MRYGKPVRVPLQTGASSLAMLVFSSIGAVFLVAGFFTFVTAGAFGFPFILAGGGLTAFCIKMARGRRASDVLFDGDGVTIEGGEHNARFWGWQQIHLSQTNVQDDTSEYTQYEDGTRYYATEVVINDTVVAESNSPDEQLSFVTVVDAIRAGAGAKDEAEDDAEDDAGEPAKPEAVSVLLCSSCGAPIVPEDAESVTCTSCGARVPIDEDLRARVRAAATVARERERSDLLVAEVLLQPGARRTNLLLSSTAGTLYLVLPLAVGAAARNYNTCAAALFAGGVLVVLLARYDIVTRQAMRAVVTGFSSHPPARQGDPHTCRRCGAPLPEPATGSLVSRCVYCQAANVMGLDLRRAAHSATSDDNELESALAARKRETLIRAAAVVAAIVGVAAVAFLG